MAHWMDSIKEIVGNDSSFPPGTTPWKGITPATVVRPRDGGEVAALLSFASDEGLAVVPRGSGTKIGWGDPPSSVDFILSLERLDRVVDHEPGDMTVTAQAGVGLRPIQTLVQTEGNRIDLDPPFLGAATLGGILATGSTGPVHTVLSDLLLGMKMAFPSGGLVHTGGRVVKNVAGFDLHKVLVGSLGTLGVITEVTLRLHPAPSASRYITVSLDPNEAPSALEELRNSMVLPAWSIVENGPWDGFPPQRVGEGRWIVHIVCEGEDEAVTAQIDAAGGILGEAAGRRPEEEGESVVLRERIRNFPHHDLSWFPCRMGIHPGSLPDLLSAAEDFHLMAHLESGLVRAGVPRGAIGDSEDVAEGVHRLRSLVEGMGGYLVVEAEAEDGVDIWGRRRADFFLMEALKREFDPMGVLSPGRLLGGA